MTNYPNYQQAMEIIQWYQDREKCYTVVYWCYKTNTLRRLTVSSVGIVDGGY